MVKQDRIAFFNSDALTMLSQHCQHINASLKQMYLEVAVELKLRSTCGLSSLDKGQIKRNLIGSEPQSVHPNYFKMGCIYSFIGWQNGVVLCRRTLLPLIFLLPLIQKLYQLRTLMVCNIVHLLLPVWLLWLLLMCSFFFCV